MSRPITFAEQNFYNSKIKQPSDVKGVWNNATQRHKRYLYSMLYSVYKMKLPELWEMPYFRYLLFHFGSVAYIYSKTYGWVFGPLTWSKLGMYYQPSEIYIYNKDLKKEIKGVVGVNAGIIRCFDDYMGFDDLIQSYAERLANCEKNININLMNSSVAIMIEAETKKDAEAIAKAYSEATTGKPFVAISKSLLSGKQLATLLQNPANTFMADRLWSLERSIKNEFLTYIGIRNANYDKKERLNSMEVSENNDETSAIVNVVFENLKSGFDELKKISGLDVDVKMRYDYSKVGESDVKSDTLGNE